MKTNNTTFSSRIKIAIVIGIASAGLIGSYLAILNYNGWSSFKPKLPLDERRIEILNATRQMPEVQAFVTRYPDATSNVTLTDYTYTGRGYTPQEANLTVAEAVVTYTAKENYPAQHFQVQPKLELYLLNSSAPYLQQPYMLRSHHPMAITIQRFPNVTLRLWARTVAE